MINRNIKAAFISSIPVLMGYLSMGMAFGVLLVTQVPNAAPWWAFFMSSTIISGSMQFTAVEMLRQAELFSLGLTFLLSVLINIRYAVYGFPILKTLKAYRWYEKLYLICALTDETYAIIVKDKRRGVNKKIYMLYVSFFDHMYWVAGSIIGATAGNFIPFDTEGIDFAMAALFIVILVDLCREKINRLPAFIGGVITFFTLMIFIGVAPEHTNKILLPAMLGIMGFFLLFRRKIETVSGE